MQLQQAHYFVYIFGNRPGADVQIGIAGDIPEQMQRLHKAPSPENCKLVYYEHYSLEEMARHRENQIKSNSIDTTYHLIESMNPNWLDLSDMLQE
ncbi:excinuclease ABC subunit C [Pontibacter sp. SGAir0037]|uniref:excinuclease ABC subunit C n=1 Tax=Pontibacter sp. SGAir0037 TaxID=2571030 RepID=UPI0010CD19B0|nr:excinuclease ABC subunit C [Pontibacter sp. SGAir0037]QCR21891.1 excinuclease ABC subunit C [Pontibacter sp. SGAir0037]